MATVSVEVVDVSKRFRLYDQKHTSLKERILNIGKITYKEFWALHDVGFEVYEGETVGILGRNGSGKSTLLKCISGILQPTGGEVRVRGQLAAMLELGAGFQPELSGRENVYLNASLLGLSTSEVDRRFDEIVAFAEMEEFIDNQVKFYSSGMYVRLGFAVAVNVDPDILVIDEVLAVGDERFQQKCLSRIKEFQNEGRTILFVTHAADMVRRICDRAVVLGEGRLLGVGAPGEAIRLFRDHLLEKGHGEDASLVAAMVDEPLPAEAPAPAPRKIHITGVELRHPAQAERPHLVPGEPLTVRVRYEATEFLPDVVFWITIFTPNNEKLYESDTELMGTRVDAAFGPGQVEFAFDHVPLLDGTYPVLVGVRSADAVSMYDDVEVRLNVMNPGRGEGMLALDVQANVLPASAP